MGGRRLSVSSSLALTTYTLLRLLRECLLHPHNIDAIHRCIDDARSLARSSPVHQFNVLSSSKKAKKATAAGDVVVTSVRYQQVDVAASPTDAVDTGTCPVQSDSHHHPT